MLQQLGNFKSEDSEDEAVIYIKNKENIVLMVDVSSACLLET